MGKVPEGLLPRCRSTGGGVPPANQAVTVLTYGTMVWVSECAARETGVDAEIIDLRTIWPLDLETMVASEEDGPLRHRARATGTRRLWRRTGGAGAAALLLPPRSPHRRVTGWDTPTRTPGMGLFPGPARVGALKRAVEA